MVSDAKKDIPQEISEEDWWRLNSALAHYERPIGEEGTIISALAHLVCQAMAAAPLQILTVRQVRDLVKDQFGATWRMGEISHAIRELENGGYAQRIPEPEGSKYALKDEFRDLCQKEQKAITTLRDTVLENWVVEIRSKYPKFSEKECRILVEDLLEFIVEVFDRYGAECAELLYYGEDRKEEFMKVMKRVDLPSLPDRGDLNRVRNVEVLDFFRNARGDRANFIGHFLRSSFLKSALAIDPKFIGTVSKQFEGSIVVLDTNFIFSLFGLQGELEEDIAKAILEMNSELGIKNIVHRISVREFQHALERQGRQIKSLPMPSRELIGALKQAMKLEGPIGAYYHRYVDTGVDWDDWMKSYLAIEARLEERGIEVTDIYEEAIEKDKKLEEETNRIYEVSREYIERISGGQPLSIDICRHDAFLRLFVKRLRKGRPHEFARAGAWCVTLDSKLPRYERIERSRLGDIPVFVLIEHWMQFVGPMTPKTEDWSNFAKSILLSPYLMVAMPSSPSIERIHRTVSMIAEYKNFNPQLATRVLLNARLQETIRRTIDSEFRERVGGAIEEALLEEYYEKEKQLELSIEQSASLSKEIGERKNQEGRLEKVQEELKGELKTIRKSNSVTHAVLMGILMLFVGISIDWSKLNQISFIFAVVGMIGGVISIIGFLQNWKTAMRVFFAVASVISLGAAILTFRMMY